MRVLLSSNHVYRAETPAAGRSPTEWPSGSGFYVHDLIAKGLAELGHEVFYLLPKGVEGSLPTGIVAVKDPVLDADILHTMTGRDFELVRNMRAHGMPWVATSHLDPTVPGRIMPGPIEDNWIFVSRTLARSLGYSRYVLNGIDPAQFHYSESKDDYLLFLASIEWAEHKGLDIALRVARRADRRLIVAGTGKTQEVIDRVAADCARMGAEYVGDVRGWEKAQLLSNAAALLFPTRVNEAFGLAMAEALMSGTPVICSANGACPEIVSPDVGFVCRTEDEYVSSIERTGEISAAACRRRAMENFHYIRMARDYVREYDAEIFKERARLAS